MCQCVQGAVEQRSGASQWETRGACRTPLRLREIYRVRLLRFARQPWPAKCRPGAEHTDAAPMLAASLHYSRPDSVARFERTTRRMIMLETLLAVLVVLWLIGMVSSYTLGGFIHVLLVVAVVLFVVRLLSGRRVV
jgi:hypothetical protein